MKISGPAFWKLIALLLAIACLLLVLYCASYSSQWLGGFRWAGFVLANGLLFVSLKLYSVSDLLTPTEVDEGDSSFLTKNGTKVKVFFADCEILKGDEARALYKRVGLTWFTDEEVFNKQWGRENGFTLPLLIKIIYNQKIYTSSLLYMDLKDLEEKLEEKAYTTMYIHKTDPALYYLDMDFLLVEV